MLPRPLAGAAHEQEIARAEMNARESPRRLAAEEAAGRGSDDGWPPRYALIPPNAVPMKIPRCAPVPVGGKERSRAKVA